MSAQITNNGFNDIITMIKNSWKYVELRHQNGTADEPLSANRVELVVSTNVEDLTLGGTQTKRYAYVINTTTGLYEIRILLKGSDSDIGYGAVGKKITGARLYAVASGTNNGDSKMEVSYPTPIQFTSAADELLITMTIKR
jgi:hypothetical protein